MLPKKTDEPLWFVRFLQGGVMSQCQKVKRRERRPRRSVWCNAQALCPQTAPVFWLTPAGTPGTAFPTGTQTIAKSLKFVTLVMTPPISFPDGRFATTHLRTHTIVKYGIMALENIWEVLFWISVFVPCVSFSASTTSPGPVGDLSPWNTVTVSMPGRRCAGLDIRPVCIFFPEKRSLDQQKPEHPAPAFVVFTVSAAFRPKCRSPGPGPSGG